MDRQVRTSHHAFIFPFQHNFRVTKDVNKKIGFRPDIEGLRAVAILLVVACHYSVPGFEGGFVGVDAFFVLSGYLISRLLAEEIRETGGVNLKAFYARRLQRLLPALVLMVVTVALLAVIVIEPPELGNQFDAGANALLWISNLYFSFLELDYFSNSAESNLYLHTWSLAVEEQFYIVWPFLIFIAIKSKAPSAVLLTFIFASLTLCLYWSSIKPDWAFYMMPSRGWQFALGAIIAFYRRPLPESVGALGLVALIASAVFIDSSMTYPSTWALWPSLATALMLAAPLPHLSKLQSLGRISYSWYLWHWPVLILTERVWSSSSFGVRATAAALSLGISVAAYKALEQPVRNSQALRSVPLATLAIGITLCVAAVAIVIGIEGRFANFSESPQMQMYGRIKADLPSIYGIRCDDWYNSSELINCGPDAPGSKTVVIMGDSIALQWYPAFEKIFTSPAWRLIVFTKSACPMVDAPFFYRRIGRRYAECEKWRDAAIDEVARLAPDLVIAGSTYTYDFEPDVWVEGTERVLRRLSGSARSVILLGATPVVDFDGANCAIEWNDPLRLNTDSDRCRTSSPDLKLEAVKRWLEAATSQFENVKFVSVDELACPEGECVPENGGVPVFRDNQHLTATFVGSISKRVEARLDLGG